ncbi:zinc ribbon domain-containing protein [Clostridium sp. 'deep sea']|uniref:zinc ribbon domain-containing protein n=1 Tax=Clostridium sp. 'deep sea' TaxID=2779445 RepID=UPI0018968944|nr:zinc ribbon domain-containing protein [Clostridium sp. 'deep sea']QOR35067.1 zinc ribbon domain-containing protein [Clostridium sp. 'deep sea']
MALFGDKKICACCSKELGLVKHKFAEGYLCANCYKDCSNSVKKNILTQTLSDIKQGMKDQIENKKMIDQFNCTKKFGTFIEFDESKKLWLVPDGFLGKKVNPTIYNFSDIVEFELMEDGDSVVKGGLGRAIVGGVLFAGVGAVVGAATGKKKVKKIVNSLKVKITVNDLNNPTIYIKLLAGKTKTTSILYKNAYNIAQDIISTLSVIAKQNEVAVTTVTTDSTDDNNTIFCRKCGNKMPSDSAFCNKCGEKIT